MTCKVNSTFPVGKKFAINQGCKYSTNKQTKTFYIAEGYFCRCLVAKLCLTVCSPMDCSLPGSSVHGILQARILQWAAFSFSRGSSQPRNRTRPPALQADTLPLSHLGSKKDTSGKVKKTNKKQRKPGKGIVTWYHNLWSI